MAWTWLELLVRYQFLVDYVLEENAELKRLLPPHLVQHQAVIADLQAGKSISSVARDYSMSRGAIYQLLRRHDLYPPRPRTRERQG